MAKKFYGIDLGTTYSCIAHLDEYGKPEVIRNSEGGNTTPSVVYFETADNFVVGDAAKQVAVMEGNQVIESVKRAMGDPDWTTEQHGREYHAQDVASFILRRLVDDAREMLGGEEIKDVVITCPAYFGLAETQATEQAGEIAGLNVHHILREPTAAAFAYGINQSQPQTIVVYDLGGGTFDATVLRVGDESIDVVCVDGDQRLGGKNWDETIAEWMAQEFSGETGVPADELIDHMETWQDLLQTAEKAKISLSSREKFTHRIRHGTGSAKVTLTRTKFNELTDELLERTLAVTEELLETARAKDQRCARIDKLLLVGGSTFMPQVKEAVTARFGFDVSFFDPNEAVAKGAALMAVKMASESGLTLPGISDDIRKVKITNVTSKSFGIVVEDKGEMRVQNLIAKNEEVPTEISKEFRTSADGQIGVNLRCVENDEGDGPEDETIELKEEEVMGETLLEFNGPLPKNSPVEVRFSLNADGLLELSGTDKTTGKYIKATFESAAILTKEEVEEKRDHNMMNITVE